MAHLSLRAAAADGFYYPPDFNAAKHKSLNKYHKSNPLGDRARKSSQGILIIVFEMPFKSVCLECGAFIAKGVRFNAEKKCTGMFVSTKIWSFSMKCPECSNRFVIRTDPENCDYKCESGIRQKIEDYSVEDAQQMKVFSEEERARMKHDPIFRLEMVPQNDEALEKSMILDIQIDKLSKRESEVDTFRLNSMLRKRFRESSNFHESKKKWEKRVGLPMPELSERDLYEASSIEFSRDTNFVNKKVDEDPKVRTINRLVELQNKQRNAQMRNTKSKSNNLKTSTIRFPSDAMKDEL